MNELSLPSIGFLMVLAGFVLALVAVILLAVRGSANRAGRMRGGAVLLIGPIPIVFGSDRESAKTMMLLALTLMIAVLLIMVFSRSQPISIAR